MTNRPEQAITGPHRTNSANEGTACKYNRLLRMEESGGDSKSADLRVTGFSPCLALNEKHAQPAREAGTCERASQTDSWRTATRKVLHGLELLWYVGLNPHCACRFVFDVSIPSGWLSSLTLLYVQGPNGK